MGELTFAIARRELEDVVTVSDAQLVEALRFFAERMKMIVEPTGCLSYAGAIHSGLDLKGRKVGVIVSGGNVDLERFAALVVQA
jgi:threonine dehydratase